MVQPRELEDALSRITEVLIKINDVQRQHNIQLIDLYERISKLEPRED